MAASTSFLKRWYCGCCSESHFTSATCPQPPASTARGARRIGLASGWPTLTRAAKGRSGHCRAERFFDGFAQTEFAFRVGRAVLQAVERVITELLTVQIEPGDDAGQVVSRDVDLLVAHFSLEQDRGEPSRMGEVVFGLTGVRLLIAQRDRDQPRTAR